MAKSAKQVDVVITSKLVDGIVKDVLAGFEQIDSARGKYMNAARRQRELIAAVYERAASQGIPQKVMKLQIKIEQMQSKLTGMITELEAESRKLLHKVVKARGDKSQLALFTDLPPLPKTAKTKKDNGDKGGKLDLNDAGPQPAQVEEVVLGTAH
jgi:hypothetical protein